MTDASARGPIAWDVAERVAVRVAGREPLSESYHAASLERDFQELTVEAERMVERHTGLRSLVGPARAKVTDRPGWIRANVASFQRLIRPFTDKLAEKMPPAPAMAAVTRTVAGAEVGALLGWMSTRVLGQYDMLIIEGDEEPGDQDMVYFVGPNVLSLEKRYAFPPREFRLWIALHELTHRAQFTGVPWLRPYFLSLVNSSISGFEPDPRRFLAALRAAVDEIRAGRNPLDEGGLVTMFATPEQKVVLAKVQGLMSVLEGHGDLTMDRAGAALVPSAPRFQEVMHQRRESTGVTRLVQRLIGLEAKLRQYQEGEAFLQAIEAAGPANVELLWRGPEWLPDAAEIRDPHAWLERVAAAEVAAS